jgi:cellulose synthase/poly-beta-1,6-N-acetylglucosamine synthase-like glycosyltransferase
MIFVEIAFWVVLILLGYVFIGYPLCMWMLAQLAGREKEPEGSFFPSVSIILSVYNEEKVIAEKIANFLALDYPKDKLEFLIISDCCSDRTDELVRGLENERIRLLIQTERSGKTKNLNRGVLEARGEILVFTDANAMFDSSAVRILAQRFSDPSIGLVSGKSQYLNPFSGKLTSGGTYRRYEDFIQAAESRVSSIVGADGAIYALRKSLYQPLRPEYINDFIHTIEVVLQGYRAASDMTAVCKEAYDEAGSNGLRRQTRIMAQSWLIYLTHIGKLFAAGKLLYAWALTSHKFLRWFTVPLMLLLFVLNVLLLGEGPCYLVLFIVQVAFLLAVICGGRLQDGRLRLPYLFVLLHVASITGLLRYLSGNVNVTWSPRDN